MLIDRGNQRVVHRVSANHGAEVSHWGFDRLLEKARADVNLQEVLVERPDLSQTTVEKLLPLISETLAIKLVERGFDVGETLTPEMMRLARDRFAEALRDRKADIRGVAALVELVAKRRTDPRSGGPRTHRGRTAARRRDVADAVGQSRPERRLRHLHPRRSCRC